VTRLLRGVTGPGRQPLRSGYAVEVAGAPVSELTSGNFSPVLGRGIGMCFLPPELAVGSAVDVEARGRRLACGISALPFVSKAKPAPAPVPVT